MLFVPEKRSLSRLQRQTIGRIKQEHIDNALKWITDRDIEILLLLLKHPFLKTEQLELMVFHDLKPSSSRTKCNQRLQRLYESYCIDRWFPLVEHGTSQQHIILDTVGFRVLAKAKGIDSSGAKWKKTQRIPQDYAHRLKIYDFKALLVNLWKKDIVGDIKWHTEPLLKFRSEGKKKEIEPDAIFSFQYKTNSAKIYFLEVDNATESEDYLKSKIKRYVSYYESGDWRETNFGRVTGRFPPVVMVFHEEELAKELCKFTRKLESNIRFLFTTYDKLTSAEEKVYTNKRGKIRRVNQEFKIRLLEPVYLSSKEKNGLVSLT